MGRIKLRPDFFLRKSTRLQIKEEKLEVKDVRQASELQEAMQ